VIRFEKKVQERKGMVWYSAGSGLKSEMKVLYSRTFERVESDAMFRYEIVNNRKYQYHAWFSRASVRNYLEIP
jgi:hypothetical protein